MPAVLKSLIRSINAAHNVAKLPNGAIVSDTMVRSKILKLERQAFECTVAPMPSRHLRFDRNVMTLVVTVAQGKLRQEFGQLSAE